jgi:DNA-directed RNA polymerase subunit RPC12/RpoP
MTRRILATLTPAEEKVLRMRFGVGEGEPLFVENPTVAEIEARAVARMRPARILVWCHTCGTSYDWPWGRCVYRCERCGWQRMSALDPGGERGSFP